MQNNNIANYIVYDLSKKVYMPSEMPVNRRIISRVVDGWNEKIYIVPHEAVHLQRSESKKYTLM